MILWVFKLLVKNCGVFVFIFNWVNIIVCKLVKSMIIFMVIICFVIGFVNFECLINIIFINKLIKDVVIILMIIERIKISVIGIFGK